MKTETKKVFVYARQQYGETTIEVSSREFDTTCCMDVCQIVSAPITEIEIQIPSLTVAEATKILSGALLSTLIDERAKAQDEFTRKLATLDQRIADLQCLEFKG